MRLGHPSEVELTDYADGELAAQRMQTVGAHLRQCRLCSLLLAGLRQTAAVTGRVAQHNCPRTVRARAAAVLTEAAVRLSCKQARGMMQDRLDHRLSLVAQVPFELHLSACRECQAELAALAGAARLVRGLPSVEAPARVREQVFAARPQRTRRALGAPQLRPALAAAFAALVITAVALVKPLVRPPDQRTIARVTAPAAAKPGPIAIAEVSRAERTGNAVEVGPDQALTEVVRDEPSAGMTRVQVARPSVTGSKGPRPEATVLATDGPRVTLPAALRALRAVAQSASSEWETQRGMELAGERFAVLRSEAMSESMLVSLPRTTDLDAGGQPGSRDEAPTSRPSVSEPGQDSSAGQPNHSSAPVREGASLNVGPFV